MKDVKELQQKYKDGDLNRRDFMKAVGALGITVSAAGSLLKATDAMAKLHAKAGQSEWLPIYMDLTIKWILV